uniref:6-phosphofructokinase n=1 Tax=Arundo donax TaxID=35708 RepID=A0A0A9GJH6_ARUDO
MFTADALRSARRLGYESREIRTQVAENGSAAFPGPSWNGRCAGESRSASTATPSPASTASSSLGRMMWDDAITKLPPTL